MQLDVNFPRSVEVLHQGLDLQYLIFPQDEEVMERDRDVLTAMNMMTQPTLQVDQESIILAGFRDCTEEAIRYLREVEHLPEDDPLVLGLKQHLLARQQQLDINRILLGHNVPSTAATDSSNSSSDSGDSVIMMDAHRHHIDSDSSDLHNGQQGCSNIQLDTAMPGSFSPITQTDSNSRSGTPISDITSEGNPSEISDSSQYHVPDSVVISPANQQQQAQQQQQPGSHQESQLQNAEMSSVLNLALLAQSNPAIASLTEEILSLLEGEDQIDTADQDSEEEADSAFLDESIE